jgi:hypothetical protein
MKAPKMKKPRSSNGPPAYNAPKPGRPGKQQPTFAKPRKLGPPVGRPR